MKMQITPEDHLKGSVIEPGWYPVIVKDEEEKVAKGDGSGYSSITMEIIDGPAKGVLLYQNFSEKAPSFALDFLKAVGIVVDKNKTTDIDLHSTVGKTLMAQVVRGEYLGKPKNEVSNYRARA